MRSILAVLTFVLVCCNASGKETVYTGSTPVDKAVREFLNISLTDSIDFMRWKLVLKHDRFELSTGYGLCLPNTKGFRKEYRAGFSGSLSKQDHLYQLTYQGKTFYLLELNPNLVHLLDENKNLLIGNGGWSYTLNNTAPVTTGQVFLPETKNGRDTVMAFEGRTPCDPISKLLGLDNPACLKLKWYMILYSDANGNPSHYLMGGTAYRKETMRRGKWDIIKGKDGRPIYRLNPELGPQALHLLPAGNTILLFVHPDGSPLVGNEDFSYTLSRSKDREARL
jgi:hypothetical protein